METLEEAIGSNTNTNTSSSNGELRPAAIAAVVKGKRTKRPRILPPSPGDTATSSSTSCAESKSVIATTEEDEDMANCLILLARGRSPATTTAAGGGKVGFYIYECKTCNKCFPSFQALGGHRASHKKPKIQGRAPIMIDEDSLQISINSFAKPAAITHKSRVHECSICGSEFSSGQALGGHMRRHRPATAIIQDGGKIKERTFLSLDLNLPAPEDDRGEYPRSLPAISFSPATALVDCHY